MQDEQIREHYFRTLEDTGIASTPLVITILAIQNVGPMYRST